MCFRFSQVPNKCTYPSRLQLHSHVPFIFLQAHTFASIVLFNFLYGVLLLHPFTKSEKGNLKKTENQVCKTWSWRCDDVHQATATPVYSTGIIEYQHKCSHGARDVNRSERRRVCQDSFYIALIDEHEIKWSSNCFLFLSSENIINYVLEESDLIAMHMHQRAKLTAKAIKKATQMSIIQQE